MRLTQAALSLSLLVTCNAHAAQYTVTDLGTLGGSSSAATAINDHGVIVGDSATANQENHAFIYQNGVMTDLGVPGSLSHGNGINNQNQIVGTYFVPGGSPFQPHAFIYHQGTFTDLGTLGGGSSYAYGINDAGQIVGTSDAGSGVGNAFVYQNGSMVAVPTGNGSNGSDALAINNHGAVTGRGGIESTLTPYIYDNGTLTIMRDDHGHAILGLGTAISDAGLVTGYGRFDGAPQVSALLYRDGVAWNIGSLGGHWSSGASINERGEVVGASTLAGGSVYNAFFYSEAGGMVNLNSLIAADSGWVLNSAASINESGQIVGSGIHNGQYRAFLLTPVPEPSVLALTMAGAFVAWRQAMKKGSRREPRAA